MADVLITGARVIDGTGNPWIYADVVLEGERIADVAPAGTVDRASVGTVIDADGMICCPGFIDIQSHSVVPFLTDRRSVSKVTQGVTTEILGEGWTPAPFGGEIDAPFSISLVHRVEEDQYEYWDKLGRTWTRFGHWLADLESRGVSVNVGSFLGGGTVRKYGMGERLGEPDEHALDLMREATRESMEDGAFGIATALIYPPGSFAGTDELVELMKVVAKHNGVHITHIRSEGDEIYEGLAEAIEIAERSGVSTEIYHLKAAGRDNWPKMTTVIERINEARARGIDIGADMYPYDGSGTGLAACLPPWASAEGKRYENLKDPVMRAKIIEEMRNPSGSWENLGARSGPDHVLLAEFRKPENKKFQGRFLSDVADELGMDWHEAICHLLDSEGNDIFTMYLMISEENLEQQFKQEWIKFSTDAGGIDPERDAERGLVHPRAYGTYPRILGRYVREKGYMSWEDAIRKASSAVADRLGLRDRGLLRAGMYADVVVFDPETAIDKATYTDPHHLSVGIRDVFVNGTAVLRNGEHTGALPGKRVNGPGYTPEVGA
ncbi:MAG TPA: D-aminoacylase [Thermomicrobiales bacterium]|nr:D-aminoacylase [Thermomicrobiales bacterium]